MTDHKRLVHQLRQVARVQPKNAALAEFSAQALEAQAQRIKEFEEVLAQQEARDRYEESR